MSELTDLEICKNIAEIKGLSNFVTQYKNGVSFSGLMLNHSDNCVSCYNPLTDDALCFKLMVEFKVDVNNEISMMYIDRGKGFCVSKYGYNNAICLAIIESHKGK